MLFSQRFFVTTNLSTAIAFLCIALNIVVLSACSNQITHRIAKWNPDDYTVKSGDTLYSIAWRYEIDPEQFTAWNNIGASNLIKPGQRLHTKKPANFDAALAAKQKQAKTATSSAIIVGEPVSKPVYLPAPTKASKNKNTSNIKWVKARKGDSLYAISKRSNVSVARLVQLNQLKKPYTIRPGQTIYLKPLPTSSANNGKTKSVSKSAGKSSSKAGSSSRSKTSGMSWPRSVRWMSPAKGKVVKTFSRKHNGSKGIDIAGKLGNRVVAAADGRVVYSGNGLISYGNLIIIKHNKTYLSAYAYNRKLLVKEGMQVKAGEKIAEMGRKDKLSPRLHFEIRKNGKSVDPLKYIR
jgi:lipoprotein NlpD